MSLNTGLLLHHLKYSHPTPCTEIYLFIFLFILITFICRPSPETQGGLQFLGYNPVCLHSIVYACLLLSGIFTRSANCPQQSWVLNLPTPRGWKAESTLSLVGFEPTAVVGSWNLSAGD
uniref:Uncharacterized protein n=1 Tax=Naja naja TaxID=35670 RepID=A0A8C6Y1Z8_NAJNA